MARVTVEDCIDKVESPYELVLVAKERTTQLNSGVEPTVSIDNEFSIEQIAIISAIYISIALISLFFIRNNLNPIKL